MSDYQWTTKEINKFIEKYKDRQEWLKARDVRFNPKVKASDLRQLMRIAVTRKVAFDNETSPDSEQYKICFNLAGQERILEELYDSMSHSPFEHLEMIGIVMDKLFSTCLPRSIKTQHQAFIFINLHVEWFYIYQGMCNHQRGENIEKICFEKFLPLIENSEEFDQNQIEDFPPFFGSYSAKDTNKHILIKIRIFINIYKALKIGWKEISFLYPKHTYNTLFVDLLIAYYSDGFRRDYDSHKPFCKIDICKISTIINFDNFIISQIDRSMKNKDLDELERESCKSILEEYNRDSYSKIFDKALNILKKVSKKDIYIQSELKNYYQALLMLGSYPDVKSFDDFLKSSGLEDFYFRDDFRNSITGDFYQALEIKITFRQSSNPKVRKAASEWIAAEKKLIALTKTRHERKPKKPKNPKKDAD